MCTKSMKHIDVCQHFVSEKLANQILNIVHLVSENQAADVSTKDLFEANLVRHR